MKLGVDWIGQKIYGATILYRRIFVAFTCGFSTLRARPYLIAFPMRRTFAASIAWICTFPILAGTVAPAQQEAVDAQTPTFRAQASLVLVDVITLDPETLLPARDLKQKDFRLFDNGQAVSIASFDAGTNFATRPVDLWLVVLCNEQGKFGGSAEFVGKESLFRPALDQLDRNDAVGVAHWCDNGEVRLDLLPTKDRDAPIRALAEAIHPIPFRTGGDWNLVGEAAFRKLIRTIIRHEHQKNPQPLPVIVFLDGDHTGQPLKQLDRLVNDFLETSGIVFGIKDRSVPGRPPLRDEQAEILHYMADQTGGQYFAVPPALFSTALEMILTQLHFRYQLGFVPPAVDGKRHKLTVELTPEAQAMHKDFRLKFRPVYIPVRETPEWAR
jgi:hypothetical protein